MGTVVIREYEQRYLAEQALGLLEEQGIPAVISSDDVGGAFPQINLTGGYRILISDEYEQRADEILSVLGDYETMDHKGLFS
jgi:hypothetical protein